MKHQEIKEMLPLYVDGGLDRDEAEWLEAHLAECEDCRQELKSYQENFTFLSNIEDIEVSDDFLASVMRRVREEQRMNAPEHDHVWPDSAERGKEKKKSSWWEGFMNIMRRRMRIPVGVMSAVAVAAILLILISPAGLLSYGNRGVPGPQNYGAQQELQQDRGLEAPSPVAPKNARMKMEMAPSESAPQLMNDQIAPQGMDTAGYGGIVPVPVPGTGVTPLPANVARKVIMMANLRVEVKDLDGAQKKVMELVKSREGYIANSNNWTAGNNQKFSSFQLRIPSGQFYAALDQLEGLGEVKQRSLNGQDVTEEYVDIQSRLKNLQLQEERYRDLLQQAQRVEDILSIERELERVRGSIESMQGQLNYYDNQTSMSTIDLELSEPEPIAAADWGIMNTLRQAFRAMVNTFFAMIVRLGQWLPYLALLLLGYGVYRIIRKRR